MVDDLVRAGLTFVPSDVTSLTDLSFVTELLMAIKIVKKRTKPFKYVSSRCLLFMMFCNISIF